MKHNNFTFSRRYQSGAALIVALIILAILTVLAVSVMESSTMEERMAGNYIDQNRVFQAAESALSEAESIIDGWAQAPIAGGSVVNELGMGDGKAAFAWWDNVPNPDTWWSTNAATYNDSLIGINTNPGYVIEEYGLVCDTLVAPSEDKCPVVYRVTARAVGGRNTSVVLQSLYARKF